MGERFGYSLVLTDAAQQMVRENVLPELFRIVQEEIEGEWKATAPKDSETREAIYHELHALNRVQLRIQAILDSITLKEYK
ncbi:hypothetical protein [Pseudomonas phage ZCPS1]|nr:hypothetical protein Delta_p05 [Pseudomonas phage Delta]QDH46228.1 hypothetical protein Pa223_067 [Pseudomonas virus Pa223]QIQ66496.1 hypothetical protein clash_64 [Pseudomonas phage clash]QIQ67467.1 hypothetical protein otherone_64 [Pseudomonas phage otherone]QSH71734.1 hypothetical protein [Pseudomonas phage vB_PaeP_fHoPae04]UPO63077.1 hypothetical protein [Pseudomonas phage ZCPS1]